MKYYIMKWVIYLIPQVIKKILITLENNGFEAYLVGGFVRDTLLYRKTNDIDIATNALPKDLIQLFGPSNKKIEYGSYHIHVEDYNVDITTYRKEEYINNKTEVTYSNNLLEDVKRRDFTINALYMNARGQIIDLVNGKEDLEHHIIRVIGNTSIRIKEDPSRILRAVRFSCLFNFKMDKELIRTIQKQKKELQTLSSYKIKKELDVILLANGFNHLKKLGLLKELGIMNNKIVYVNDISGLWAQIKTTREYPFEKGEILEQKKINNQIKCGTINMLDLYRDGYYECRVVASIIHFPMSKLTHMENNLPIRSLQDIVLSPEDISMISHKTGKELGILLKEIEENIVKGKLENEEEIITKYIQERG